MTQHVFYGRPKSIAVVAKTDSASMLLMLYEKGHLVNPENALRDAGVNYTRLFEAFSPDEIREAIADETGRDIVMVATVEKAPGKAPEDNS